MLVAALASCAPVGAASALPSAIDLDKPFILHTGESAAIRDGSLRVGFERVVGDSRCPRATRCVWAGDAVVRVWLQRGAGPKAVLDLHTATGQPQTAAALDHQLRLIGLDPDPATAKAPSASGPVATLLLTRDTSAAAER